MYFKNFILGKGLRLHCEHHMLSKMTFGCEKCMYKMGVGVHKHFILRTLLDLSGQVWDIIVLLCIIPIQKFGSFWPHSFIIFLMNFYMRQVHATLNLYKKTGPCPLKEKCFKKNVAVNHILNYFLVLYAYAINLYTFASS